MNGFRYLDNVATLKLAEEGCIGCGRCPEVCPHQVFTMTGKRRARIVDLDGCIECGACMINCPTGALTVDAGVGCATGIINEWLREHNIRISSCCSSS